MTFLCEIFYHLICMYLLSCQTLLLPTQRFLSCLIIFIAASMQQLVEDLLYGERNLMPKLRMNILNLQHTIWSSMELIFIDICFTSASLPMKHAIIRKMPFSGWITVPEAFPNITEVSVSFANHSVDFYHGVWFTGRNAVLWTQITWNNRADPNNVKNTL